MPIPIPTILGLPTSHLPLLLHLVIEIPASLSFLLRPESQLPLLSSFSSSSSPSPPPTTKDSSSSSSADLSSRRSSPITTKEATEARLILRNFGGLLLSVNLVIVYLLIYYSYNNTGRQPARDGEGELIRGVTGCLSLYHVFPLYRAWRRMCINVGPSSSPSAADGKKKEKKKKMGFKEKEEEKKDVENVKDETQKTLGGPVVHFVVHMIVGGLMGAAGFGLL